MNGASISPDLTNRLQELAERLAASAHFAPIADAIRCAGVATIDGAVGSSCALAAAAVRQLAFAQTDVPHLVIVCSKNSQVDDFVDDLELFGISETLRFPAWESDPGCRLVYDEIYGDRLRTLKTLLRDRSAQLIVCSIQSLLQRVPPPRAVEENSRRIAVGQTLEAEDLARWLVERRFHAVSGVELPGEFARRGGILDVYAADWDAPVRIEWFDNQIESMRRFDVNTQRRVEALDEVEITVLPSRGDDPMRAAGTQTELAEYLQQGDAGSRFLLIEPGQIELEAQAYLNRHDSTESLLGIGEARKTMHACGVVEIANFAAAQHDLVCRLPVESVERFSGEVGTVRHELSAAAREHEVFLICQTSAEIDRLTEIFSESELARLGRLHFVLGRLTAGFHLTEQGMLLLSGNQLFRRTVLRRKALRLGKRKGKRIDSFLDLRQNDLVVHLAHGIGRYRGLELLRRDNQIEEHLTIEFHGGTKIYVPSTKIELVQKYVGGNRARVRLATIGGKSWQARRKAAESAVQDVAVELLELQARRAARPGISFGADTEWQREFDASFPYEETDDQHTATAAIKNDMIQPRPMDRLLCGDVGFGKTEVAMRAAFKAVDNGYQVAVMVPTTILAEQHYRSFRERFSEFPFAIAKLSRFCTAKEQREIIAGLASGQIDVVIGTHRLASRDVHFDNLGILIIDEEQRFGVDIKERLKALRSTVDVLTMTATPIPRTLHMALTGMRDIANLETAPEERIAVETRVTRWDDDLIRHAIMRELDRGGQVYFVHNRIHDIDRILAKLGAIVPEATIRVGHGQMPTAELETVMVDFVEGRFDLLLSTTIVESGLDIPNANTMFIDTSDCYGLADLHQLRGRVGRYKNRAYCYLLVEKHKHITPEAARRLRAIEEFSAMGAGFAIAMRDLEFRGAGNILGTQQSGHIAAVGYELYCQLLESAVRRLKKLAPKLSLDVNIDLPGDAFLPDNYVPDLRTKIDLYRRIARAASGDDISALVDELRDRFGELPRPVYRLLELADLKMDATLWSVHAVRLEHQDDIDYLFLDFTDCGRIKQMSRQRDEPIRIIDNQTACVPLTEAADGEDALAFARRLLKTT
jgi:transcription-repair coupling factor (superfamily II helicase)